MASSVRPLNSIVKRRRIEGAFVGSVWPQVVDLAPTKSCALACPDRFGGKKVRVLADVAYAMIQRRRRTLS